MMVINRGEIKRKRKDTCNTFLLDDTPKRTKVHAQRKFAQGSNVSSPVLTPIKELERLEKAKPEILPEPTELLPANRPNTEDFLTFLCFRGTPILPPNLNFFNTATTVTKLHVQEPKSEPNNGPIASSAIMQSSSGSERPFIAFGVRKRADPMVISKQMDKKRREALTLNALRRQYQEQRMAKIRAVTISKLSEKIEKRTVVRTTRSTVTKVEVLKKKPVLEIPTKLKVVEVERLKPKVPVLVPDVKEQVRHKVKPKMCLRSFRGRFIQQELTFKAAKKRKLANRREVMKKVESSKNSKKNEEEDEDEEVSDFSSDDDEPLVKAVKTKKKVSPSSVSMKSPKIVPEVNFRLTRSSRVLANKIASRRQQLTKKLLLAKSPTKAKVIISKKLMQKTRTEERQLRSKGSVLPNTTKGIKLRENNAKLIKKELLRKEIKEKVVVQRTPEKNTRNKDETTKKDAKRDVTKDEAKTEQKIKNATKSPSEKEEKASDSKVSQRPTRKTKEAAAIYMELLGQKLVNDGDVDDDNVSIDSFPELPNVRRTEQRENELKAKAKVGNRKTLQKATVENPCEPKKVMSPDKMITRQTDTSQNKVKASNDGMKSPKNKTVIAKSASPVSKKVKEESDSEAKKDSKLKPEKLKPIKQLKEEFSSSHSESDETVTNRVLKKQTSVVEKLKETKKKFSKDPGDESVGAKSKEPTKKLEKDHNFDDSDEEPLSKLTQKKEDSVKAKPETLSNKIQKTPIKTRKQIASYKEEDSEKESLIREKLKRECTKRPQSYQLLFSSSEDEEKYFHGFNKTKPNKVSKTNLNSTYPQSADLLRKDIVQSFGKGKMNMSTEQIEQWLKDSALATTSVRKENDEMLKFGEKIPTETSLDHSLHDSIDTKALKSSLLNEDSKSETKIDLTPSRVPKLIDAKQIIGTPKTLSNDRKLIFRKLKQLTPNAHAFSASNESSIYAFGEENETAISTPFRRLSRRPSSTATSRSEDDFSKGDESFKTAGKFRLPLTKQDLKLSSKHEIPLVLSTDDPSCSASIAVQVNLESPDTLDHVNIECATQTDADGNEHLFYIPLQPGKQSQVIQGVAVKLGTENERGTNSQRVVMRAKLVTKSAMAQDNTKAEAPQTSMFPPSLVLQKCNPGKMPVRGMLNAKIGDRCSETSDDVKYKVPSSPSASSSSSANIYKKQNFKPRQRLTEISPITLPDFPTSHDVAAIIEAPVFHPNDKEFQDPLEYIEKIRHAAEKFGICRIIPPSTFKPECKVTDDMRFTAYNQHVHKMLHRWGPNLKEFMAIKKYLKTQNITLRHPPWIGGVEIDLPRLYQTVQSLGGLKEVIEKKKWPKVSELMKIPKSAQDRVTKLDDIYCKYLLPYDTLSPAEREKLFHEVETDWAKRESRTLSKVQRKVGNNQSSSSNESDSDSDMEAEECTMKGRNMALNAFYRIARNTMSMWFRTSEPTAQEVEQEFWKHVTVRQNHICVHSGSIDSGNWGYGFAVSKNSPFARHAWNLKVLTNNSGSVLRSMGPIMGVTVPTLHVGMVFSSCCWYRDPHCLPWIEYLHTGGNKIWYGIPDSMSEHFHTTLLKLVPNYCRNKTFWLPSDTVMVPPSILVENGVSLCRTVQEPGQFVVVFPKTFTSSVSTGYVVSESVYFAPPHWLKFAQDAFHELRNSCEPSVFSLDRLILSIAHDTRANAEVWKQILPMVREICGKEKAIRAKLKDVGVVVTERLPLPDAPGARKRRKLQGDDGDYECDVCRRNLFVSMLTESQDDGVFCLEHGLQQIQQKKIQSKFCKLLFTYNDTELEGLIDKLRMLLEHKLQKKVPGKFSGMPTLLK